MEQLKQKGDLAAKQEQYETALDAYKLALDLAADAETQQRKCVVLNLALCALKLNAPHDAIEYARASLRICHGTYPELDAKARYRCAQAHWKNGDLCEALISISHAQRLTPADPTVTKLWTRVQDTIIARGTDVAMFEKQNGMASTLRLDELLRIFTTLFRKELRMPLLPTSTVMFARGGTETMLVVHPRLPGQTVISPEFRAEGFASDVGASEMEDFLYSIDSCKARSSMLAMLLELWQKHGRLIGVAGFEGDFHIEEVRLVTVHHMRHAFNPVMVGLDQKPVSFGCDGPDGGPVMNAAPHQIVELRLKDIGSYYLDPAYNQAAGPDGPQYMCWPKNRFPQDYLQPRGRVVAAQCESYDQMFRQQCELHAEYAPSGTDLPSLLSHGLSRINTELRKWAHLGRFALVENTL